MKVACIGNMNNIMFTLCRYLRDKNFDASLFLFDDEADHFLPEADTYNDEYRKYTTQLSIGRASLHRKDLIEKVKPLLKDFDVFIGTDIAPALVTLIGKRLNIFVPHGSDIYSYPFVKSPKKNVSKVWWSQAIYFVGKIQKIGIENSELILFPDEYDAHFPFKKKLNFKGEFLSLTVPMIYVPQYQNATTNSLSKGLKYFGTFNKIRASYDFIVFSHARQNGRNLLPADQIHDKGNHKLISAFANFIVENKEIRSCLILFEYGINVNDAKNQINDLKISEHVIWMPKMQRKEILYGLTQADVACGEFANSWLTCGVVNEALAVNTPLIHFREDKMYEKNFEELYPILNAHTAVEILNQLKHAYSNKLDLTVIFKQGSKWIEKYTVLEPLEIIEKKLNQLESSLAAKQKISRWQLISIRIKYRIMVAWYQAPGKIRKIFRSKATQN